MAQDHFTIRAGGRMGDLFKDDTHSAAIRFFILTVVVGATVSLTAITIGGVIAPRLLTAMSDIARAMRNQDGGNLYLLAGGTEPRR